MSPTGKLRLASAAVFVLLVLVAYLVFFDRPKSGHDSRHRKPYEYLYLDSGRVDSFLGELDEGQVHTVSRQETESSNASLGFQLDTVGSATATQGRQLTVSAVVTKTEADNFYSLLEQLEHGSLTTVDASSPRLPSDLSPSAVPVGSMVRIKDAFLRLPPYLSPYPLLRYARFETRSAAFGKPSLSAYSLSRYTAGPAAERARIAFIRKVGPNPRLPFSIERADVTIVIPARFANLTGDASLLSARLTVVGKVAFNVEEGFGDGASEDTYLPALLHAPPALLRELGVREPALRSKHALFKGVSQSLTFPRRVVEVVPIAIYN
jgi:hypothetical protein